MMRPLAVKRMLFETRFISTDQYKCAQLQYRKVDIGTSVSKFSTGSTCRVQVYPTALLATVQVSTVQHAQHAHAHTPAPQS
eukprot:3936299-Rhodomonas_salina.1